MRGASLGKKSKTFLFDRRTYLYFNHEYNRTWANERTVEIPIVWERVARCDPSKVLEVGNVLSHYFATSHKVVDKYEKGLGVTNVDVADFRANSTYDLIVSISTLEHVCWDEKPRDPGKISRALTRLESALGPGGILLVTIPIGWNPNVDRAVQRAELGFTTTKYLKRITFDNTWEECSLEQALSQPYGKFGSTPWFRPPFPGANAVVVGEYIRGS